ncbi:YciI family protein [Amycolatopsis methanolica]|uniref:YciI family protein n=1 Tax=Amycolatopsis methanolica TaxID=1814 RepID=UPI0034218D57
MKYMVILYGNQELWDSVNPDEWQAAVAAQDAFNEKYFTTGELLGAYGIADPKVVRVRDGQKTVTDGPYLETKEYLASVAMLEVDSEERALEIAADNPFAAFRQVEVWPVWHGGEG